MTTSFVVSKVPASSDSGRPMADYGRGFRRRHRVDTGGHRQPDNGQVAGCQNLTLWHRPFDGKDFDLMSCLEIHTGEDGDAGDYQGQGPDCESGTSPVTHWIEPKSSGVSSGFDHRTGERRRHDQPRLSGAIRCNPD